LAALVSDHGRCWSILSRLFDGRSENDIKNRWYSHVQHDVVREGGRLVLGPRCTFGRFPERKKRRRAVVDVKENARRLLEGAARGPSVGSSPLCDRAEVSQAGVSQAEDAFHALFGGAFPLDASGFEWFD
jgi:hypothetical protein